MWFLNITLLCDLLGTILVVKCITYTNLLFHLLFCYFVITCLWQNISVLFHLYISIFHNDQKEGELTGDRNLHNVETTCLLKLGFLWKTYRTLQYNQVVVVSPLTSPDASDILRP